ncbi:MULTISPECIES: hypothetical protein [unclassified Pseudomonas]|uniref:hypothetical protein n=1 Tax=unclassified Pseudomonas TaxID=196821 RepID=UPI0025DFEC11|nr:MULTISPECIES: hypothetical protein [unclassified Pseudomonas]
MTPYPGQLIDDEIGFRILKCYIYKFIKNNIHKRPRYDVNDKSWTKKNFFWFNTLRPMFGSYHTENNLETLSNLRNAAFLSDEPKVYFMPQYIQEKFKKVTKSYIYCSSGTEVQEYLSEITAKDLQNITIFNNYFTWAVDIFEDTLPHSKNEMDVVIYVKKPK